MAEKSGIVYRGNCNCGRYRYELSLQDEISTAQSCTCSLCAKKGYLWVVPPEGSFSVIRDDGRLTEYTSGALRDKFCNYCGTGVTGEHTAGPLRGQLALNVRAIQGVDPFKMEPKITTVELEDERQIQTPEPTGPPAPHLFSCHCGDVQAELLAPIQGEELKEDNCSSCVRNAYIGVYPTKDKVRLHGEENGFEYFGIRAESGGDKRGGLIHCKKCGVYVFNKLYGPPITIFDGLPPERKARALEMYHRTMNLLPLNVRAMEGFRTAYPTLKVDRADDGTAGYAEQLEPWKG